MELNLPILIRLIRKYKTDEFSNKEFICLAFNDLIHRHKTGCTNTNFECLQIDRHNRVSEMCSQGKIQLSLLKEAENKDTLSIIKNSLHEPILQKMVDFNQSKDLISEIKDYIEKADNISESEKTEISNATELPDVLAYSVYYCLTSGLRENHYNTTLKNPALKAQDKPILLQILTKIVATRKKTPVKNDFVTTPYTIQEKASFNELSDDITLRIQEVFDENYALVMEVIDSMVSTNPMIFDDLSNFYRNIYFLILDDLNISINLPKEIKEHSTEIFRRINSKVIEETQLDKNCSLPIEQLKNYTFVISVVIFYKCKFLLKVEKEG